MIFMFIDSSYQVVNNTNIKRTISFTCYNLNIIFFHIIIILKYLLYFISGFLLTQE